ncbi:MAG: methyl-accepting chemotaxis protein, partial [Ignavibacteriales bacterium]
MKWFYNLKISKKLIYSFLLVSFISLAMSTMAVVRFSDLAEQDTLLYNDCVVAIQNLSMALARFERANAITRDEVMTQDMSIAAGKTSLRQGLSKEIGGYLTKYEPSISTPEERQLYDEFLVYRKQFKEVVGRFDQLIGSGQTEEAKALINGELEGIKEGYRASLQKLIDLNIDNARKISESNTSNSRSAILNQIILSIIGVALSIGLGIFVSFIIKNPVTKVLQMAQEIQKGHVKARANVEGQDEIGIMAKALDQVASQLDALAGGMHSISKGDLSVEFPAYDKDDALSTAMNTITVTLRELVNEVKALTTEAVNGNIESRGRAEKYDGGYKLIVSGFNNTLDEITKNISDYEKVIEKVGQGDLTARMIGDYRGNYKLLQNNANEFAETLGNLISDVNEAIAATASAASEISSSSEQMSAGAQEQSQQATEVAGAVEEMTKTILESSQFAAKAAENSRLASESAQEGAKKVDDTKKGMLKIVESTKSTGEKITSLA